MADHICEKRKFDSPRWCKIVQVHTSAVVYGVLDNVQWQVVT